MNKYICVLILLICSCTTKTIKTESEIVSKTDIRKHIRSILDLQEKAWNEGDFESFMLPYWKSDSLKFLCAGKITYSRDCLLSKYQKTYYSKNRRGVLKFDLLSVEILSETNLLVIGKYHIERLQDIDGGFSLLWKKIDGKWKIIFDHSS